MSRVDGMEPFAFGPDAKLTDPKRVHDQLVARCSCPPALAPGSGVMAPRPGALPLDCVPLQLAHLLAHLCRRHSERPYGKLVHVGTFANFAPLNEALRGSESGVLVAGVPPPLEAMAYGRARHFRCLQLKENHEAFAARLEQLVRRGDLLAVDLAADDAAAVLPLVDRALAVGADVVLFNVRDPNFPNLGRLWNMCVGNQLLETVTFCQAYDTAVGEGGGIGFARLLRQNAG